MNEKEQLVISLFFRATGTLLLIQTWVGLAMENLAVIVKLAVPVKRPRSFPRESDRGPTSH